MADLPRKLNPGDPLPASWLAQLLDAILSSLIAGRGIGLNRVGNRVVVSNLQRPRPGGGGRRFAFARVTGAGAATGLYQLVEIDATGADLTGGRVWDGTTGNETEARALHNTDGVVAGTRVIVYQGEGGLSDQRWVFEITDPLGLPEGGLEYQVLQRDASGNAIWDYPRAHP